MPHLPFNIIPNKTVLHGLGPPLQLMRASKGKEGSRTKVHNRISGSAFVLREGGYVGCEGMCAEQKGERERACVCMWARAWNSETKEQREGLAITQREQEKDSGRVRGRRRRRRQRDCCVGRVDTEKGGRKGCTKRGSCKDSCFSHAEREMED